jgi:hypothetical protein
LLSPLEQGGGAASVIRAGDSYISSGPVVTLDGMTARAEQAEHGRIQAELSEDKWVGVGLQAGELHYRAFVGPPERYDLVAAMQFNLLTTLGLRDNHTLLDIGCGSLRLGRLAIPYLRRGRYFGLEPNRWLVEEGIERECGRDLIHLKKPSFRDDSDFRLSAFGVTFDYLIAQSIFTHAAVSQIRRCLAEARRCMHHRSLFVANYFQGQTDYAGAEWVYPGCVNYTEQGLIELAEENGLSCTALQLPTINGTNWMCYGLKGATAQGVPPTAA